MGIFQEASDAPLAAIEKEALRLRDHIASGSSEQFTIDSPALMATVEILSVLQNPIMSRSAIAGWWVGPPHLLWCPHRRHCDWNLRPTQLMKAPLVDTCTTCGRPTDSGVKGTLPCTMCHSRVALEGSSPQNVLGRAILHFVELVEYLSGRRFEGLVETAEDGTRYLFVDPDIWEDLVDSLFKEIWDMCSELDFDQAVCYPVTEDYAMDHDPLDLETVSSEGTFMMVEENRASTAQMTQVRSPAHSVQ